MIHVSLFTLTYSFKQNDPQVARYFGTHQPLIGSDGRVYFHWKHHLCSFINDQWYIFWLKETFRHTLRTMLTESVSRKPHSSSVTAVTHPCNPEVELRRFRKYRVQSKVVRGRRSLMVPPT